MSSRTDRRWPAIAARMWLLELFDGAARAGFVPLDMEKLHSIIFLANALAPSYDLMVPDRYLLKYKRGPFFPNVQWDVGRLVAQGLVTVENPRAIRDEKGYWVEAQFSLSSTGMEAVDVAIQLPEERRKALYLRELCRAFVSLGYDIQNEVALFDINYRPVSDEHAIDFRYEDKNFSSAAVEMLMQGRSDPRVGLHTYVKYLGRMCQIAREAGIAY